MKAALRCGSHGLQSTPATAVRPRKSMPGCGNSAPAVAAAIKGIDGFDRSAPVDGPTYVDATEDGRKIRRGVRLWKVSVAVFKSETYRFLRLERPTAEELADGVAFPDGFIHLPAGISAEWVKQLTAEQLVTVRDRRGFTEARMAADARAQ